MKQLLEKYKVELELELKEILAYWADHTVDNTNGGFIGQITKENKKHLDAPKGSVLNSRILWSFSAAYHLTQNKDYRLLAQRAFHYITNHFIDKEFGGVYWSVSAEGKPLETKKQIYALSFCIYGLVEFYKATGEEKAKEES